MIKTIKKRKVKFLSLLFATGVFFFSLCFGFLNLFKAKASDNVANETQAYYLGADYDTRGYWYKTDHGAFSGNNMTRYIGNGFSSYRADPNFNVSDRYYGKDGLMMLYYKITGDGQPVTDGSRIKDLEEDSTVNYVEKPSYLSGISTNFEHLGDDPFGYWNYRELVRGDEVTEGAPLSPNPETMNRKDVYMIARGDMYYSFNITDDEWHKITVYTFEYKPNLQKDDRQTITVEDLDGNVKAEVIAEEYTFGVYYSFAVKGSFQIHMKPNKGTVAAFLSTVFFDKIEQADANAKTDFSASIQGARNVALTWNNADNNDTLIYRKSTKESVWTNIARVKSTAKNYVDTDTTVSATYDYMLVPVAKDTSNDKGLDLFYAPSGVNVLRISTHPYSFTSVEFAEEEYYTTDLEETIYAVVKVKKDVKYNAQGEITDVGIPYSGIAVRFKLAGESVTGAYAGIEYKNMNDDLGYALTDENGEAMLSYVPEYYGEYSIVAYVDEISDPEDVTKGYAGCETQVKLTVSNKETRKNAPYLLSVTEAVKPGDSTTIFGNDIGIGKTIVAYAPASAENDVAFSENIDGLKYLTDTEIKFADETFNTGVMFRFPETEKAGVYRFWVKNSYGWSNCITMNAARPLFISQEGSYEGLPIEIVGRNFFGTEFGKDSDSLNDIKIQLVRIGNIKSKTDGITEVVEISPKFGTRKNAADTYLNRDIAESNPYRLTFITPKVNNYGTFKILVSNDGVVFNEVENPQTLVIYEKKAATYSAPIATDYNHIGNDPLDLGVYWAQDLNYTSVKTVPDEFRANNDVYYGDEQMKKATSWIQNAMNELSRSGGGVIYFPDGYYYIGTLEMQNGVILVGESVENTIYKFSFAQDEQNFYFGFRAEGVNNYGIVRMTLTCKDINDRNTMPELMFLFAEKTDGSSDVKLRVSKNVFLSDLKIRMYKNENFFGNGSGHRGTSVFSFDKNFVIQNVDFTGENSMLGNNYVSKYVTIRNSSFAVNGLTCQMGFKYAFVENTYFKSGLRGHGWSGRSEAYCADNYIADIGAQPCDNRGEIFMFEPPVGQLSRGEILYATERTFTVNRLGGQHIGSDSKAMYNYFAVMIVEGKGAGQLRYFENTPIAGKDGNVYGNSYELCANEKDWDIVPDSTSKYSIFLPMVGNTVYNNYAEECAKSICIFSQNFDMLCANNELINTEGISLYSVAALDCVGSNGNVRIENNYIDGISKGTGRGGISIDTGRKDYFGVQDFSVVIRGNTLKNLVNDQGYSGLSERHDNLGIAINTTTADQQVAGDVRYVIIENNNVENSLYGVYIDNRVSGVIVRNNKFKDIRANEDVTVFAPVGFVSSASFKFIVGGKEREDLNGEFDYNELLPVLNEPGKNFWGWSLTEEVDGNSTPITVSDGNSATLYAIFGYKLTLNYNYSDENGTDKGVYKTITVLKNQKDLSLGRPIRVGYTFEGWYTDSNCTIAFDESDITSDLTLYAKWVNKNGQSDQSSSGIDEQKGGNALGVLLGIVGGIVMIAGITTASVLIVKKKKH